MVRPLLLQKIKYQPKYYPSIVLVDGVINANLRCAKCNGVMGPNKNVLFK